MMLNQEKAPEKFGVTIIVPTKGRETLRSALLSLVRQTCVDWQAIVICDGFEAADDLKDLDSRIRFISCVKTGTANHAGAVRNIGIKEVTTKWIGFVDDDDLLADGYVELLKKYDDKCENVDIVIFTMINNGVLIPSKWNNAIVQNDVGISYAYKSRLSLEDGLYFNPSSHEDYDHLNRMTKHGASYMIDRDVSYIVRPE